MFTISVCMIVKDEELVLDRILTQVEKFADEIIVVDTGSVDKTCKIAQSHNAKLYHFKWCEDFAKARNFSFSKATKDYTMWLDADDYINESNIEKILKLKSTNSTTDVFMFKYLVGSAEDSKSFEFYRERLLKTSENFMWCGFVHEVITPHGKIEYTDIEIIHRKEKENPKERNLKIYRHAIKNGHDFSPREQYYYSRELYFNGYFSQSIKALNRYMKMKDNFAPNIIDAYIIKSRCFIKKQNFHKALSSMLKCIDTYTPTPEICCVIAETQEYLGNTSQAIFWYKSALISEPLKQGFIQRDYGDFIPCLQLCKLYYHSDKNESKKYFELAKVLKPNHPSIIFNQQFFTN